MRWPFAIKDKTCEVRVFNHPKTGVITLRLQGNLGWPSDSEAPVIQLGAKLEAPIDRDVAEHLLLQLAQVLRIDPDKFVVSPARLP
jgi:hypothetical protein